MESVDALHLGAYTDGGRYFGWVLTGAFTVHNQLRRAGELLFEDDVFLGTEGNGRSIANHNTAFAWTGSARAKTLVRAGLVSAVLVGCWILTNNILSRGVAGHLQRVVTSHRCLCDPIPMFSPSQVRMQNEVHIGYTVVQDVTVALP